jgi:hypothetical protein
MPIFKKFDLNRATPNEDNSFGHHLEIKVREGTSDADISAIVNALAAISEFFGVKFVKGGGGSGGKPLQRHRSMGGGGEVVSQKEIRRDIEIPRKPDPKPENRVGGSL